MKGSAPRKLLLLAGVAAAIAGAIALRPDAAAEAPGPSPAPDGGTSVSEVQEDPSAVREYWTPERMENAEPAPMEEDD
ncbi:hypothetical protein LIX60_10730 [Streptomyces sp. S07_1.15]|uniref:hypothetical protein n=1 Tax=Streptomyces sp. S07_1.15 TaxID=2873925 RepID=UPI001D158899|nr:hypothetical protein [Streptomyces sp. S07_1.15]MCC3651934.1 hypothetical protein [Streptomyces sp. S07_1.15]